TLLSVSLMIRSCCICFSFTSLMFSIPSFFLYNDTSTTEIYTLSLHDALPISAHTFLRLFFVLNVVAKVSAALSIKSRFTHLRRRSEEHTSELQSRFDLVCRLLLEKKKNIKLTKEIY